MQGLVSTEILRHTHFKLNAAHPISAIVLTQGCNLSMSCASPLKHADLFRYMRQQVDMKLTCLVH